MSCFLSAESRSTPHADTSYIKFFLCLENKKLSRDRLPGEVDSPHSSTAM